MSCGLLTSLSIELRAALADLSGLRFGKRTVQTGNGFINNRLLNLSNKFGHFRLQIVQTAALAGLR